LTQDVLGLHGTVGFDGKLVRGQDKIDKGLNGLNGFGGLMFQPLNGLLSGSRNYAKHAKADNWLSKPSKNDITKNLHETNKAINANKSAAKTYENASGTIDAVHAKDEIK
jgi:hypothetical protein